MPGTKIAFIHSVEEHTLQNQNIGYRQAQIMVMAGTI